MSEFDPCSRLLFLVTDIILALATFPSLPFPSLPFLSYVLAT